MEFELKLTHGTFGTRRVHERRDENDAELKQRLFEEAKHTREREESEKTEFERLSKKFTVKE